jgi:hypothetical protein
MSSHAQEVNSSGVHFHGRTGHRVGAA